MKNEEQLDYLYKKILKGQEKTDEAAAVVLFCLTGGIACIILALIFN
jgi:hypothetical protein